MKTINTTWADFARGVILLGRQGENLTGRLHVDVSEMLEKYPGATFGLRAAVPGGEPYPVSHLKRDGAAVVWTITNADTAQAGEGWAQLVLYGGGQEIAKTEIAHTLVLPSLTGEGGTPPDAVADWLNRAEETLGRLEGLSILPPITVEDDGKVLTAVNGAWVPMEPTGGGGEGDALPPVTEADNGKILMVQEGEWAAAELPKYEGTYEITPLANEQTTLLTAQKFMTDNVAVKEIPYFETSNQSDGETVYIGTEVEIYGD